MEDKSTNKTKDTRQDEREYFDWDWKMSDDTWEVLNKEREETERVRRRNLHDLYGENTMHPDSIRIRENLDDAKGQMTELVRTWAPKTSSMQYFFLVQDSISTIMSEMMLAYRSFRAEMVYDVEAARVSIAFYQKKEDINPSGGTDQAT